MRSDNAGGGLRGLRAIPSQELLEALNKAYQIDTGHSIIDLGGSSSLNLLATDRHHRYVVRVYRPYVTADRLDSIQLVRRNLAVHGVPCSEILSTRQGQTRMLFADRLVEVERYVDHDSNMDSWEGLKAGLPLLGRIHSILRTIETGNDAKRPLFANHIEPFDTLSKTSRGTRRIRAWNSSPEEQWLADTAEELAQIVYEAEKDLIAQLPRQLVHGDFWDNNVLFRDGHVVLIADFDFMGERARIDDLALNLYYTITSLVSLQDSVSDDGLRRLRELVNAYDNGLDDPLTSVERAALPLAIARQPLWSIGGWVALLDDEESARQHAVSSISEIKLALHIIHDIDRWQAAFV